MDFGRSNGEIGRKMANGQLLFLALILNALIQNQAIQKVDVPLIGRSSMPHVRVGVVGRAMD